MPSTRLRRAFAYPTDDLQDTSHHDLDEEEQEQLITSLQSQDDSSTTFYTTAFVAIPLFSALAHLPSLYRPSSASSFLSAILAISSLLASAYILYFLPLVPAEKRRALAGGLRLGKWAEDDDGPINRHIVALNGALSTVLGLRAFVEGRRTGWAEGEGLLGVLPLVIYLLIVLVRWHLKPIDIEGLEKMRYGYKGA
ncbi:hypothetical protein EJ05DRAFT_298615 [Pseudovirgaria hyperparasitica]|uniref:Uncharacterized protein n=1 Tax=Pseudovirgaria hyperparasitica TaxID=470096 RepID=A0A6A6WEA4_9PEZI|nr:uncharacterized protein EJ05DRAFT_298615 [Pseudovirgaria hyperparasitica]KAF2759451.1 hypothetical protein EJ05DRAFT_298615 [Pseudovirgaria hyperparasitica]